MEHNLIKYLHGECDAQESAQIAKWLEESPELQKKFEEIKKVWSAYNLGNAQLNAGEIEEELEKYLLTLNTLSKNEQKHTIVRERHRSIPFFLKIASVVVISIGLSSIVTIQLMKQKLQNTAEPLFTHQVIAPNGSKSISVLPDGTKVWLNAGSRLTYPGDYGIKNRNVELEGEAYFKVVTNPKKPFVVITSELKIKAYGTAFNVKAYPDEKVITTTLEEGKVSIEGKGIDITLKPKQNVRYERREFKKVKRPEVTDMAPRFSMLDSVNTIIYTAWKDDQWIIDSETLPEVAVLLERKFNVQVSLESAELHDYRFRGKFSKETLEQILDVFRLTAPIEYKIEKGVVSIKLDKKRKAKYQEFL